MLLYHTLFYILTYLLNCIYILYEIKFLSLFIQKTKEKDVYHLRI